MTVTKPVRLQHCSNFPILTNPQYNDDLRPYKIFRLGAAKYCLTCGILKAVAKCPGVQSTNGSSRLWANHIGCHRAFVNLLTKRFCWIRTANLPSLKTPGFSISNQ
jgi:hypothetical protein